MNGKNIQKTPIDSSVALLIEALNDYIAHREIHRRCESETEEKAWLDLAVQKWHRVIDAKNQIQVC